MSSDGASCIEITCNTGANQVLYKDGTCIQCPKDSTPSFDGRSCKDYNGATVAPPSLLPSATDGTDAVVPNLVNIANFMQVLEGEGGLVWDREREIWTDENFQDEE